MYGHVECMCVLFRAGANVNQAGLTSLITASLRGRVDAVRVLLEAGALVNLTDADGFTALMSAATRGHVEVVRVLLSARALVNYAHPAFGATALMLASIEGHVEIVDMLLKANANPRLAKTNGSGDTALTFAQRRNHHAVAALLQAKLAEIAARSDSC